MDMARRPNNLIAHFGPVAILDCGFWICEEAKILSAIPY